MLEADEVVYNRKTKRVTARGNARLTESTGTRYFGDSFELTDDFRDGFVERFRAVLTDNQRFLGRKGRTDGRGADRLRQGHLYPLPALQGQSGKGSALADQGQQDHREERRAVIYFEDARLEFWGRPVAYLPFFSTPDPSVRRKTGFLTPQFVNGPGVGFGVSLPYFFNIAPDMDITVTPTLLSRQGVLGEIEWRHRLGTGSYNIALAGIHQLEPTLSCSHPPVLAISPSAAASAARAASRSTTSGAGAGASAIPPIASFTATMMSRPMAGRR